MAKVTSKLQFTIPKAIALQYKIKPGIELDVVPSGDSIRLLPPPMTRREIDTQEKLRLFDAASVRMKHGRHMRMSAVRRRTPAERGWTRESLYDRGRAR